MEALFCSLCLHRSVQTASLPEMDASGRGIAFYRYRGAPSLYSSSHLIQYIKKKSPFVLSHTTAVSQQESPFIFNGSTLKGELAPAVTVRGGEMPPLAVLVTDSAPVGFFFFLRVLVEDGAALQYMASCGIAERL